MQEWRVPVGMLLLAGLLSALVKYVLPRWVEQPYPGLVWSLVLGPAIAIGVVLIWRDNRL